MKQIKGMLLGILIVNLGVFAGVLLHPIAGIVVAVIGVEVFACNYVDDKRS